MKVINVLKIVDIEPTEFNEGFIEWLNKEFTPTYQDTEITNEHIYSIGLLIDNRADGNNNGYPCPIGYMQVLKEIEALCRANDSGYFRISYN